MALSSYSPAVNQISQEFHVSKEVSLLGLSFCLLEWVRYCESHLHCELLLWQISKSRFGPLVWAPFSELYGRKWSVLIPCFLATVFSFGTATAKDIQTILITRFFTGFFGSAPVSNTGGVLGDIWAPTERGYAIMAYSLAVIVGPTLGPIVGGAVVQSYLGWRWTEYVRARLEARSWIELWLIDKL